jgi:ribosomal protein S18 acetylase RimI-like enzyme
MKLTLKPLTPANWPDLESIFRAKGCSIARGCWCMYYRGTGQGAATQVGKERAKANRAALKRLTDAGNTPPGLIGYRGQTPVGWISLGPRADFRRLERSQVMRPVDDEPVWSIVCFVVPSEYRHQGVARQLLDGAIAYARKSGAELLEAYPFDRRTRTADAFMWFGSKSMFDRAGFVEVARRKPTRPIMRRALSASDRGNDSR